MNQLKRCFIPRRPKVSFSGQRVDHHNGTRVRRQRVTLRHANLRALYEHRRLIKAPQNADDGHNDVEHILDTENGSLCAVRSEYQVCNHQHHQRRSATGRANLHRGRYEVGREACRPARHI